MTGEKKEEKEEKISKATIARMPLYLHFLQEENTKGTQYISSTVIAQNISVSSVLVRKDLALVSSEAGRPKLGFGVSRLIVDIEKFLGYDNIVNSPGQVIANIVLNARADHRSAGIFELLVRSFLSYQFD